MATKTAAGAGIALFGLAVATVVPGMMKTRDVDPGATANEIGAEVAGRVREAKAAVHSRLTTLAELPRLAVAVQTDAATVRDLTSDELAFRPQPNETITIGQVGADGKAVPLLSLPEGAPPFADLGQMGTRVRIAGRGLVLTEVAPVRVRDAQAAVRGVIAMTAKLDLAPIVERLDKMGASLTIEVGDERLVVGSRQPRDNDRIAAVAGTRDADVNWGGRIAVPPADRSPLIFRVAGGVLFLGGLAFAFAFRPRTAAASASGSAPGTASTKPSSIGIEVGTIIQETYEITGLLGQGGMGKVWKATHRRLPDKRVALKVLSSDVVSEDRMQRFRREAEITSKLGHPNIVDILDFNTLPDGTPYLVLELLEGESLSARLARGPLPVADTLAITSQIASALGAAHRANIVHRDLKPGNIFLTPTDTGVRVKVLDFGISKIRGSLSTQTRDTVVGTPQYMSPEQANGKNAELDARTDIWALGAIVYEMLTARPAFNGETVTEVILQIILHPSPSLAGTAGIPPHVAAAIDRALRKAPDERFADTAAFIAAPEGRA